MDMTDLIKLNLRDKVVDDRDGQIYEVREITIDHPDIEHSAVLVLCDKGDELLIINKENVDLFEKI